MTIHNMHNPHHFNHSRSSGPSLPSPLEIAELAKFDDMLTNEAEDEKIRKRILYLKDASNKLKMKIESTANFKYFLIPFALIPLFWPFILVFYLSFKKQKEAFDQQTGMALEYWQLELRDLE